MGEKESVLDCAQTVLGNTTCGVGFMVENDGGKFMCYCGSVNSVDNDECMEKYDGDMGELLAFPTFIQTHDIDISYYTSYVHSRRWILYTV